MKNIKKLIKTSYGEIARQSSSCCGSGSCCGTNTPTDIAKLLGYSDVQLSNVPEEANLGLGCGNPLAIASLRLGETVLDLGSGAGFDSFLASRKVGKTGRVIGVDMTEEMIKKAKENAKQGGYQNVEFRKGDIENLPVESGSVDTIISNCVINLAPDKKKVFKEAYRVLKQGGRMIVSDVVLTKKLPEKLKKDKKLLVGCVSGAIVKQNYLELLKKARFSDIKIYKETPAFLDNYGLSITFSAVKK